MLKVLAVIIFFLPPLLAQAGARTKVSILQISKEQTPAYAEASFDARIIVSLKKGQKLYGIKKKVSGIDGLGLFHKVRLKKGVYAYVLDTAVKGFRGKPLLGTGGGISGRATRAKDAKKKKRKNPSSYEGYSIPYAKSYGIIVSSIDYGLKTSGQSRSSKELFMGLKLSGVGWLGRFPFDLSILYSPSSPKLLDSFTQAHSGSILFLEGAIPLEWRRGPNWSIYGSLGAVVSHSDFELTLGGETGPSKKTELGYSLGVGGGMRFGRYLAKLELKYTKTGAKHIGCQLSFQRIF